MAAACCQALPDCNGAFKLTSLPERVMLWASVLCMVG
jgi:hypothetical protein